ncbi:MAG: dynamin family protein, partial [Bacteroidales bacterium]|nr:dynamin family protein [Bacteroidales bacterium]
MDNYENLFQQVDRIIASQSGVDNYNVTKAFDSIRKSFDDFKDGYVILRRENQVLKIGVVGQVKAGKSSFLNSLFFNGESVLPKASTPMTAGLTVLEYGEESEFVVEYYNESEWQYFERNAKEYDECVMRYKDAHPNVKDEAVVKSANIPIELISANELVSNCADSAKAKITEESTTETKKFSGIRDLQEILEDFVGAKGKFTSVVKCLTIRLKDERLKDVCIVDTPGVNDPVVSRELRTRDFLRECHGVFFLSSASQFCNSSDVSFLSNRVESQGISKIVVIASRFDSVLQDLSVAKEFKDDLWGAVESCSCKLEGWFKSNVKNP